MKRFLLEISVMSLLAPGRSGVAPALVDWFRAREDRLFISTVTIAELRQGICKLRRTGSGQRARSLAEGFRELIDAGEDRIVPFDTGAAPKAGEMSDAATSLGRHPRFADVAIAAVAAVGGLVVLTRNGRHFEPLGVSHADPSGTGFLDAI